MARSFWRRLAPAVVLLVAGVACSGGGATDPKDQLIDAMRAMGREPGVTLAISLDTDEQSLRRLGESGDEPLSPAAAAVLTRVTLRVSVPFDPEAKAMALALDLGDGPALELRAAGDALYLRADVPALLRAAGEDPAAAEGVRAMLAQTGIVPAEVVDGRWLAIQGLSELAGAMTGEPVADPLDQAEARRAMERFVQVLADSSSVTRVGKDERGDHLRAAVPLRDVYAAWMAEARSLGVPGGAANELPAVEDVPDETMAVDLWVKDGGLSAAAIDAREFAALDPEGPEIPQDVRLAIELEFERFDGVVQVPSDAVPLDTQGVMGLLMGGMAGAFGGSMAGVTPMTPPPAGENTEPTAMAVPNPVLVAFYNLPGYGGPRAFYCGQIGDMPESQKARHYRDICPTV